MMPYTKITQMVQLHQTKGPPELEIEMSLYNMSSWSTGPNLNWFHRIVSHGALYQICTNGSDAARALDKNCL